MENERGKPAKSGVGREGSCFRRGTIMDSRYLCAFMPEAENLELGLISGLKREKPLILSRAMDEGRPVGSPSRHRKRGVSLFGF